MINNAVSMFGTSYGREISQTMIFTDSDIVIKHEAMAKYIISKCLPLFNIFDFLQLPDILSETSNFNQNGVFYAFLPVPAFFAVSKNQIEDILADNGVDSNSKIFCNIMKLNKAARHHSNIHLECDDIQIKKTFLIFQIEKLVEARKNKQFLSTSLTLACGKEIYISYRQYAEELRILSEIILENKNINIVLVSEKDGITLPSINCWCQESSYIIQMLPEEMRI